MGLDPISWVAIGALALSAAGAVASYEQQRQARKNQKRAQREQEKIRAEQKAQQAQAAAAEKRKQIREERVRRARILQSAENTGVSGSSGEIGALGALSTNLGANLGFNASRLASANRISAASSAAADFTSEANQNLANANLWGQVSNFGSSIFNTAGGFNVFSRGSTVQDVSGETFTGIHWDSYSV